MGNGLKGFDQLAKRLEERTKKIVENSKRALAEGRTVVVQTPGMPDLILDPKSDKKE